MVRKRPLIAMVAYTFYASDPRVRRHVSALVADGYDVDVLALRNPKAAEEKGDEHVEFFLLRTRHYADQQPKFKIVWEYVLFALACSYVLFRNHLFRGGYSLIHINNMPNFLVFSALSLRLLRVPVVLDVHDTMPEIYRDRFKVGPEHWVIRLMLLEERISMRFASFVITTEHTKWERLIENGLKRDKSIVTLNLPDSSIFPSQAQPGSPADSKNGFKLVYHGTLTQRLGMDIAIRAMDQLKDRIPNICLDIIGDGEQRQELLELTQHLDLGDYVHFSPGFIPTNELPQALAGADLAVVPSRNRIGTSLMLPTKLLEYVRLGIPCVTVATPTTSHYFDEDQVRFVPSEDVSALAEQILYLYNHPEERLTMANAARRFYDQYSFETERDRYLNLIRDITRKKASKSEQRNKGD